MFPDTTDFSQINFESEKDWSFQDWLSEKTYRDDLREILVEIHGLLKFFLGIKKETLTSWIEPLRGSIKAVEVFFFDAQKKIWKSRFAFERTVDPGWTTNVC